MPTVKIRVIADAGQARDELGRFVKTADSLPKRMKKLRAPAAGVLAGVGAGAAAAIRAASDLNETVSKSQQIFGSNAGAIDAWASGAAKNLGLSKQAALDSAAGFGDMFSQIGFAGDEAAKMSTGVVQMSADLGSFNNLPTADVSERIAAAFRGEYDSLQKVIPNINAARVEQEAMAATGKKTAGALTAQEKAAAVLAIVQKDGARAMGDFARTADGAANSQKTAAASAQDLAAKFGQQLLPAYTSLLQTGTQVLGFLAEHSTAVSVVAGVLAGLAVVVLAVSAAQTVAATAMTVARGAVMAYTAVQWLLNAAMAANPVGLVVLAIVALVAVFVIAWHKSETFRNVVTGALTAVKNTAVAVWDGIKSAAGKAWDWIKTSISDAIQAAKDKISSLRDTASGILTTIRDLFSPSALLDAGRRLIRGLVDGISGAIGGAVDAVKDGLARIKGLLPGSPIKWGPLRGWNRGGAGKRLMGLLASGIEAGAPKVTATLAGALDPAAALTVPSIRPPRNATPARASAAGPTVHQEVTIHEAIDGRLVANQLGRGLTSALAGV